MPELLYNYKPIFTLPCHYIKHKDTVHEGYENFSFNELDYEITDKDIRFIEYSRLDITHHDFEKVIDIFEKIVVTDQIQSMVHLTTKLYEKVTRDYA